MANEFIARNGIIARDSSEITGSLKVTGGITGSVLGTSSFATALVGGTTVNIADESSLQGSSALINFTGNAVAATVSSNTASVSISTGSTVSTIAGTTNEILVNNGTSAVNGAVTLSLPATVDLGANSSFIATSLTGSLTASSLVGDVRLGTQTSGDYVANITAGNGLASTGATTGENISHTLSVNAGAGISVTAPTSDAVNLDTGSVHFLDGVKKELNTETVLSGSVSSPSQGTISVGGFTNIDLGLQTGDNVTFNNITSTGNVVIQGNLTAQQFIVSSSVYFTTTSFSSGSTIFGNDLGDTHQFTGSLRVLGSITGSISASNLVGDIILGTQTSGQYASTIAGGAGLTATAANANDGTAYTIDAVAGLGISLTAPTNDAINIDTGSAHFTGGVTNRLNTLNVLSGSVSSPSQGTISVGGFANIDLGLQSGDDVTFNRVTATNGLTGSLTASSLIGDIRLGTQTSGDYVQTLTQGTGVTITSATGEGSNPTIAIGQAVATTSNVQFNNITASIISASNHISGGQIVATTGFTGSISASFLRGAIINTQLQNSSVTVGTTAISLGGTQTTIAGLVSLTSSGLTGSLTASSLQGLINNNQLRNSTISGISLGSNLANLTQGTGVTAFTYNGSTAQTIAIGQDVGTTANVTFGSVTGTNGLTGSLTASSLRGAIINTQLQNSSVTIGNTAVSLGGTATTITGLTSVTSTNFVGTASFAGTASYALTAGGTGGSTITIADEGTSQGSAGLLNFTGNAVTATVASNTASLTISTGSTVSTVAGTTNQIAVNGGTAAVNGAVTISLPSTTNLGAASSFTATSLTGSLTASSLQGAILNTQLQNSSVTVGSTNIALGGTATTIAGITSLTTTNLTSSIISASNFISGGQIIAATGFTGSISSSGLKGAILNSQLQNSSVTVGSTNISLGGTATTIAGLVSLTSTGLTGSITASSLIGDIRLGTQTSGDYVQTLTQGTGVTITSATGEGSNPTIAIGQAVGTTSDVTFNRITATNGLTGSLTASSLVGDIRLGTQTSGNYVLDVTAGAGLGKTSAAGEGQTVDLVVNAGAGISLTAPTNDAINIDTGSAHFTNGAKSTVYAGVSGDITINSSGVATIAANSVVLGTDTTGQYASTITGGAGLTATTAGGDDATAYTIDVNAGAGISLTAPTTDAVNIDTGSAHFTNGAKSTVYAGVSGDVLIASNGAATIQPNSVALGTDTTGDYVSDVTAGAGLTKTSAAGEGQTVDLAVGAGNGITVNANDIAVIYGSTTNTAVQGNTTLTFSGTTNEITIDAGSSITLGSGGTITYGLADTIGGNRTFSADLTVQGNTFLGDATSDRVNVTSSFNVSGSAQFTGSFGVLGVTNIRSNGVVLNIDSINSNTNKIGLFDNGTVRGYLGASSTQILTVADSGGNIELSLDSSGNLISAGEMTAFGTPSDISYKEDISPITNALEKIIKLDGVKFKWKKDTDVYKLIGLEDDLGFIAQDVQNILPNIVRQNENGKLSLRERAIIPLLVESIKELKAEINNLKNKIEKFGIQ